MKAQTTFLWVAALSLITTATTPRPTQAAVEPEEDAQTVATFLKPISDSDWSAIAGSQSSRIYEISRGDTLSGVSERLFGDAKYWPKIWALNPENITNPHVVSPGQALRFDTGSGSELPALTLGSLAADSQESLELAAYPKSHSISKGSGRSNDWKTLPRQRWESVLLQTPPQVDPLGFDRRSQVSSTPSKGVHVPFFVQSETLESLGEIIASPTIGRRLSMNQIVSIEPEDSDRTDPLTVGETYVITTKPRKISADGRTGYVYRTLGLVQIEKLGEENVYGRIIAANDTIDRGAVLVRARENYPIPDPIVGSEAMEAQFLSDPDAPQLGSTQNRFGIITLGSQDGIREGMVFRSYARQDEYRKKDLFTDDAVTLADFIVVAPADSFSIVLTAESKAPVRNETPVRLITDASEFTRKRAVRVTETLSDSVTDSEKTLTPAQPAQEEAKAPPVSTETPNAAELRLGTGPDELEELDRANSDALRPGEQKELEQLETWNTGAAGQSGTLAPPTMDAPSQPSAPETAPLDESALVSPEEDEFGGEFSEAPELDDF